MKAVFVGGGSLRLMGILRQAMSVPGLFDDGEINLYDLDARRSEVIGRMLMKTPEFSKISCKIVWNTSLEKALEGADMVGVIMMAGSPMSYRFGGEICLKNGFIASDNVSPNGAFLALKGGPIVLDIARKMEKLCPDAWLLDFANPVAVLSGIVNHHTKIKALGVCQGYTNHQADLTRIIMRKDKYCYDYDLDVAGVNHLSFIIRGSLRGKDIFPMLDKKTALPWIPPKLNPFYGKGPLNSIKNLARIYRELGVLIFSTEGDGMMHLMYDECLEDVLKNHAPKTKAKVKAEIARIRKQRQETDLWFQAHLDKNLPGSFWKKNFCEKGIFNKCPREDIFIRILVGIAGNNKVKIATSFPNNGAVRGFPDRTVLEYSQLICKDKIEPVENLYVPDVVYGMTASLAIHQTMLADSIATEDPKLLARALLSYPIRPYSKAAKKLSRELLKVNADEISPKLRKATDYL